MINVQKLPNAAGCLLTISSTATDLLTAIRTAASDSTYEFKSGIDAFHVFVETNSVRWLDDGNTPTATQGHLASAGSVLVLEGADFRKLKFIRATGSDATITVRVGYSNPRS